MKGRKELAVAALVLYRELGLDPIRVEHGGSTVDNRKDRPNVNTRLQLLEYVQDAWPELGSHAIDDGESLAIEWAQRQLLSSAIGDRS